MDKQLVALATAAVERERAALEAIDLAAVAIQVKNPGMTYAKAYEKAILSMPATYDAYQDNRAAAFTARRKVKR